MTLDEFNKKLQDNKDAATEYSTLLKAAITDATGKEEYPKIMSKIAADLGFDVPEEEFSKKGGAIALSDDELGDVAGGSSLENDDPFVHVFKLFFPWFR